MTTLIDPVELRDRIRDMYRDVAEQPDGDFHFETGRAVAERLGYPAAWLDAVPPEALASFAGVGHMLDLAAIRPGETVLDLGSGSGTDSFIAASLAGVTGRVIGVDMTDAQLAKARRLARASAGRVRRGPDRGPARRARQHRRRHLQRRDQPRARQARRLPRHRARAAAGRPARHRRHRVRAGADRAHALQRVPVGRVHRRRRPVRGLPIGASRPPASRSSASAPTTTASCPRGRRPRPTSTASPASACSRSSARSLAPVRDLGDRPLAGHPGLEPR